MSLLNNKMHSQENKPNLFHDIDDYLESIDDKFPITEDGLEEIIDKLVLRTGMRRFLASTITILFFQTIRNKLLRNNSIILKGLGKFYVSSPLSGSSKKKIFIKFEPAKSLIKKMNG